MNAADAAGPRLPSTAWRRRWTQRLLGLGWLALALAWALALPGTPRAATGPAARPAPPAFAASAPGAPRYRFRQPPAVGLLRPVADLLDAEERAFVATLPVVKVGLNLPDNRPYEVIEPGGEISGIQVEILTHVAQALGIRLEPVVLPSFPEALAALRERRVDMMATLGYEPAREAYMGFTLGTAPNPGAIIGREADLRFEAAPSLNGRRVALEAGYVTHYYVHRLYPDALVADHPDTASALRAVALGEDDYYFGSLLMATDRVQRDAITGLALKRALIYATGQMHFGVRRDWPLLTRALSKGVAALRQAPLPGLRSALAALGPQANAVTLPLSLGPEEQRQVAGRSVLKIGAVRGLPLLNDATPGGGHSGIAADYTAQVMARLGMAFDVVPFDSVAQMLDALREGSIHMVPFLTRTPAREREFVFSQPYLEMPYLIVARSDAPLYWDLDSLRGKRLALALQHPLRELLAERWPDVQIVDAKNGDEAIDMVIDRRADAAVEVKLFAHLRINGDPGGRLRQVARVEQLPAQFHFALAQPLQMMLPLVDRALADIPPDERERLLRRWVAIDLSPGFPWQRHLPWLLTAALALVLISVGTAWWMRRLAVEVRERRRAEARLRDISDSLPGAVFHLVVDANRQVVDRYFNGGSARLLGDTMATPGADPFVALIAHSPPAEAERLRDERRRSLRTLEPFRQTLRIEDPARGTRWLLCEAHARQEAGGGVAWTGWFADVTGERALQAQLLDAVQAKNLFVASASHELRAPLQVIALAVHRLGMGRLDESQRQIWRMAQDACDALLLLVDDVLDLTRLEAGRMPLQPTVVVLPVLLAQIVEQHRLAAERRGLDLRLDGAARLPERALLDPLRLRQVLANLIGNAVKYTPQGRVDVLADTVADGRTLRLQVRDTGTGISPQRLGALFEPFESALDPTALPGVERSTGLGLAICKRLVEAMGGSIALASTPGEGTCATVHLPLAPLPADGPHGGSLLLVDDDEVTRLLMATMLRAEGFAVIDVGSAEAALACWRSTPLAAVISDRHMPGGDGLALLQTIRREARSQGRVAPRLLLCSGDSAGALPEAEAPDAVLHKPVSIGTLRGMLASLDVRADAVA